ncbi:hypothetical protein [Arthrobacter sp. CP30]
MTVYANVRTLDRHRAIRAALGFIRRDSLAIDDVLNETADDETPGATAALVLALTEMVVLQIGDTPEVDAFLTKVLVDHARESAD